MGDKTLRLVLLGKIDRAIVTRAEVDGSDAVSVDRALLDAAGLLEHEKAELYDVTTGARFAASLVAAERDTGELAVTGPAAHLVNPGDLVVVAAFGWMKEKAAQKQVPNIVLVDAQNRPVNPPKAPAAAESRPADPFHEAQLRAERRAKKIKARAKTVSPLRG